MKRRKFTSEFCTSSAATGESGLRIKPSLLIPSFSIVHPPSIESFSLQLPATIE
jgi:hypothetical protein